MSDPQYYQYEYKLNQGSGIVSSVDGDNFTAFARGDLDGDTVVSTLSMDGKIQTSAGNELVLTLAPTITEDQIEE
jgi:hypothetical protein